MVCEVAVALPPPLWKRAGSAGGTQNCPSSLPPAERLSWVSLPHDLTFPFGRALGAVGSHWPGKRYGGASINPGP